jgi:hypothetical protein
VLWRVFKSFDHEVEAIVKNFEGHNATLKKATLHADRWLFKAERDTQVEWRMRLAKELQCVQEEVRKGSVMVYYCGSTAVFLSFTGGI